MHAFDLDSSLVENCSSFSRSFCKVRALHLKAAIDAQYADGHFWPDALLSINPRFERGKTTSQLLEEGMIAREAAQVLRMNGQVIAFHTYQTEAIAKRNSEKSFVVTTGFELGHLAATICGYERFELVKPNQDAASRDSLCAF
jgi:hypothetical protein